MAHKLRKVRNLLVAVPKIADPPTQVDGGVHWGPPITIIRLHWHHKPPGLMVKGLQFPKKPKFHGLYLYPRVTHSTDRPWRLVYPPEAVSGYNMAKSWSASIMGQVRYVWSIPDVSGQ